MWEDVETFLGGGTIQVLHVTAQMTMKQIEEMVEEKKEKMSVAIKKRIRKTRADTDDGDSKV